MQEPASKLQRRGSPHLVLAALLSALIGCISGLVLIGSLASRQQQQAAQAQRHHPHRGSSCAPTALKIGSVFRGGPVARARQGRRPGAHARRENLGTARAVHEPSLAHIACTIALLRKQIFSSAAVWRTLAAPPVALPPAALPGASAVTSRLQNFPYPCRWLLAPPRRPAERRPGRARVLSHRGHASQQQCAASARSR